MGVHRNLPGLVGTEARSLLLRRSHLLKAASRSFGLEAHVCLYLFAQVRGSFAPLYEAPSSSASSGRVSDMLLAFGPAALSFKLSGPLA